MSHHNFQFRHNSMRIFVFISSLTDVTLAYCDNNNCCWKGQCSNPPSCNSGTVVIENTMSRPSFLNQLGCSFWEDEHWIKCCDQCGNHVCSPDLVKKNDVEMKVIEGDADTFCCYRACKTHSCSEGLVMKTGVRDLAIGGDADLFCCERTCALISSCPTGQGRVPNSETTVGSDINTCCRQCPLGSSSPNGEVECRCLQSSDESCTFQYPADTSKKWLLPGSSDRVGRSMDIQYLGESSKLKKQVYALDDIPTNTTKPESIGDISGGRCVEFHTEKQGYWVPSQVSVTSLSSASCTEVTDQIATFSGYSESTSREWGVSLGADISPEFSAAVGYSTSRANEVKTALSTENLVVNSRCDLELYSLSIESEIYSDEFKSAVKKLPTTYHTAAHLDFVKTWGTHVITSVTMGGRLEKSTTISTSECWKESVKNVVHSIEADFTYKAEVSGSGSIGRENGYNLGKSGTMTSTSWKSNGGDPALLESDMLCTQVWRASVRPLADMTHVTTRNIGTAVYKAAIVNGDNDGIARQISDAVDQAVNEYLGLIVNDAKEKEQVVSPKECNGGFHLKDGIGGSMPFILILIHLFRW